MWHPGLEGYYGLLAGDVSELGPEGGFTGVPGSAE